VLGRRAFQQNAARSPEEGKAADDSTKKTLAFLNTLAAGRTFP
jgi:hypothetical protein